MHEAPADAHECRSEFHRLANIPEQRTESDESPALNFPFKGKGCLETRKKDSPDFSAAKKLVLFA
jgi:hypothetical protein